MQCTNLNCKNSYVYICTRKYILQPVQFEFLPQTIKCFCIILSQLTYIWPVNFLDTKDIIHKCITRLKAILDFGFTDFHFIYIFCFIKKLKNDPKNFSNTHMQNSAYYMNHGCFTPLNVWKRQNRMRVP